MTTTTHETGSEGLVEQTKSELVDAASTVQDKALELKQQGRSKLGETLDQRTTEAGGQAREAARALRQSGSQMRMQADGKGEQVAQAAEWAADRVDRLGGYLEQASGERVLRDAEDFARRRPWMVAGAGLIAGLAASRFLKASSERRYGSTSAGRSTTSRAAGSAYRPPTHGAA